MDAQETRIYIAIIITSVVLGAILVYFIVSIIKQQRRNLKLHKLNILAEITALEKDRARIAADMHDELGPMLSAVKMKINSFELSDEEDHIQIERTNHHIDEILRRMREISFDLMPNTLLRKGLVLATKEFVDYINTNNHLAIEFEFEENIDVGEQKAINVYRIVQEVIHNTLKHAQASKLQLSLKKEKNKLVLSSLDNGVGFNYNHKLKENIGFGLRSILSRTEIMGGEMFLESKKGKGTTYTFEIPL